MEPPTHMCVGYPCCCCYNYAIGVRDGIPVMMKDVSDCEYCANLRSAILASKAANKNPRCAAEGTQYAFTLTMPPDYQPAKPLSEVAKLIMEYGLTNKPYEKACKYAYVLEHTANGTPHIHGVYQTKSGRRIASKYFKRYHDLWTENPKDPGYIKMGNGFKGGYHQKVRSDQSYEGYLEKEGVVIKSMPIL